MEEQGKAGPRGFKKGVPEVAQSCRVRRVEPFRFQFLPILAGLEAEPDVAGHRGVFRDDFADVPVFIADDLAVAGGFQHPPFDSRA
jgi:hypothetical protein